MPEPQGDSALVNQALYAYQHDAEIHATVHRAMHVIDADQRERTGLPLSDGQQDTILMGAMVAVHLRNADLTSSSDQAPGV